MRCLCWERVMCERKAKKDAPAAVVSRAACVSRAPLADASRPALAGWSRPAWSLWVNLLSTILKISRHCQSPADVQRLLSLVWCEMRCLCWERVMCERKVKKDAPAAVVSRAACVSRAPLADASRQALAG